MNEAYLCLGGNLGNCIETFDKAVKLLENYGISVIERSALYRSEAWGMQNTPDFHNLVLAVKTGLSAQDLMKLLLEIENKLGRQRNDAESYQSRSLDMDILFFNADLIQTVVLEIPHPRLHLRKFVLEPMNEIAPDHMHPVFNKTISDLLEICPDKSFIKKS